MVLLQCKEQNSRVDEALFPHTYNPNLALVSVVGLSETVYRLYVHVHVYVQFQD